MLQAKSVILTGDAKGILRTLATPVLKKNKSIYHACVTSPPYYKLRDYSAPGQLGQEETPTEYVRNLVRIFREVSSLLHPTGSLWLNLGDTYKDGQLLGIPWRVAFALQHDGWFLQQDCIWAKTNPMTGGSPNRFVSSHEYVFVLSKSKDYYFDQVATQEEGVTTPTRNKRSVFLIPTRSSKLNHFALMPAELAELCISGGTSPTCCRTCKAPYIRQVARTRIATRPGTDTKTTGDSKKEGKRDRRRHVTIYKTTGWDKSCNCKGNATELSVVIDPFSGMATTGLAAIKLGRCYVGIEINPETAEASRKEIVKATSNLLGG